MTRCLPSETTPNVGTARGGDFCACACAPHAQFIFAFRSGGFGSLRFSLGENREEAYHRHDAER